LGVREFTIRPFDFPKGELGPPNHLNINRGVIIERCFTFELPVDWDIKIWVETPKTICLERGLQREGAKVLGERATTAWSQVWQPRESRYIANLQPLEIADYVLDGTQPFENEKWRTRNRLIEK
jgi:uridine kinase